jgi:hypothetical protein
VRPVKAWWRLEKAETPPPASLASREGTEEALLSPGYLGDRARARAPWRRATSALLFGSIAGDLDPAADRQDPISEGV